MSENRLPDYLQHIRQAAADQVPWRNMRGMRNRIAHGYFDVDLDVVWDTVQTARPDLALTLGGLDGVD